MDKIKIGLTIQAYEAREKIVSALANSGYSVWVEVFKESTFNTRYIVFFECEKDEISSLSGKINIDKLK